MNHRDPLNIAGELILEKYRIERLVGEGGFAVVYRAQHTIWNKPVAIKFFSGLSTAPVEQRDDLQHAFIQEGALLTELSSQTAGIVQARDVGAYTTPGGQWMPYMVLEWLDGYSLEAVLENERQRALLPWTEQEVVGFLARVLPPLDVAHARGIAHRDVKPANLFVLGNDARSPETPVKILDFGVAKMVDNTHLKAALAKTGVGITSFTPQYGAPEQFTRSFGATGPWTDVYAMALVAVEMLTGTEALQGDDLVQLGYATANIAERPTPRVRGARVTDALERVFQTALAVDPKQRFSSAAQFLRAAEEAIGAVPTGRSIRSVPPAAPGTSPSVSLPSMLGTSVTVVAPGASEPRHIPAYPTATPSTTSAAPQPGASAGSGAAVFLGVLFLVVAGGGLFLMLGGEQSERARARIETLADEALHVAQKLGSSTTHSPPPVLADPPPSSEPAEDAAVSLICPEQMAKIDPAEFRQGSDAKMADEDEKPAHPVALEAYCIDLFEVTAAAYGRCVADKKCRRPSNQVYWPGISRHERKLLPSLCTYGRSSLAEHPINCVNWTMADTYCKARGKRLPTEAEWEYAARGPQPRNYPWGDEEPTAGHLNGCDARCASWGQRNELSLTALHKGDDGFESVAPVGKYPLGRSPFGLHDMAGNVWEWVSDWHGLYPERGQKNPTGPTKGTHRVLRGAAWDVSYASRLRPSQRNKEAPNAQSPTIGFRCAAAPSMIQ